MSARGSRNAYTFQRPTAGRRAHICLLSILTWLVGGVEVGTKYILWVELLKSMTLASLVTSVGELRAGGMSQ